MKIAVVVLLALAFWASRAAAPLSPVFFVAALAVGAVWAVREWRRAE